MTAITVPFYDLTNEYRFLRKNITSAIRRVLEKQQFVLGEELSLFEKDFSNYLGVNYSVGVGSGTDGLVLALRALGVQKGDEVITQANTFIATAYAISSVGATPVLVDADPLTHQVDPLGIEKKITKKTKVIIPVHLFGSPAPMREVLNIAKKYKLKIVEDACQGHGGEYNKKKLGSLSDISVFSFYPSKNLGAYGDGGAVCTNSKAMYKNLMLLRNYGEERKYSYRTFGTNSRLDELQAAILRVKLKQLEFFVAKRNEVAEYYKKNLKSVNFPSVLPEGKSAYHLFVVTHSRRNKLKEYLKKNDIFTQIHYPIPIHLQKVYENLGQIKGALPVAEKLASTSLSLPLFFGITETQRERVVKVINNF